MKALASLFNRACSHRWLGIVMVPLSIGFGAAILFMLMALYLEGVR